MDFTRAILTGTHLGRSILVRSAGYWDAVVFERWDSIYTRGLSICYAVCVVWELNDRLVAGALAHVSSEHQITKELIEKLTPFRGSSGGTLHGFIAYKTRPIDMSAYATVMRNNGVTGLVIIDQVDNGAFGVAKDGIYGPPDDLKRPDKIDSNQKVHASVSATSELRRGSGRTGFTIGRSRKKE